MKQSKIKLMEKLHNEGLSYRKIAKKLNVTPITISYHLDDSMRNKIINASKKWFKNLPKKRKKEIYNSRLNYQKEYQKKYQKNRYKTDKEFRKKKIEYSKTHYKKKNDTRNIKKR